MEYTSLEEVWEDFEPNDENFNNEIINDEETDNLKNNIEVIMTDNKTKSDEIKKLVIELEKSKKKNIELTDKLNKLEEIIKDKDNSNKKSDSKNDANCTECHKKLKFLFESKNVETKNVTQKNDVSSDTLSGFINQNKDMIILILLIICIHFILKTLRILKNLKNI
jgi:hypothetical protein